MTTIPMRLRVALLAVLLGGCATRAVDVQPLPANPSDFAGWSCDRIDDEIDTVQQRAAEMAYSVDERVGNNIVALGLGLGVFWPALLAMRPDGPEAAELARLKGRFEALRTASALQHCPPVGAELSPRRSAVLPVQVGERLVYEDRIGGRPPSSEWSLRVIAFRRDEFEFRVEQPEARGAWRQDLAGNVSSAPPGSLYWAHLLRRDLELGQVLAGEILLSGDPLARARVRGQVVAVGPQMLAGRHFDVAVIDLFGDVQRGDIGTRLEGAIVVDRASGVLLRLDLRSSLPGFDLQRRLSRVESAP